MFYTIVFENSNLFQALFSLFIAVFPCLPALYPLYSHNFSCHLTSVGLTHLALYLMSKRRKIKKSQSIIKSYPFYCAGTYSNYVLCLIQFLFLGIAQEINARSEVFRIERQLEEARGRLTAIRQAKYKLKGGESDGETDGYQSGYDSYTR